MKTKLTVYQKPTCTKCRTTLRFLKERGVDFEAVNYVEASLTEADLRGLMKKLGLTAIVVRGGQAVLGRRPENVEKLL
jgi:arsenate reductase